MDLGLHCCNFSAPADPRKIACTIAATARTAEQAGFVEFNVMDHYFQLEQREGADKPMLEAYTTLGYVAALTNRIRTTATTTGSATTGAAAVVAALTVARMSTTAVSAWVAPH